MQQLTLIEMETKCEKEAGPACLSSSMASSSRNCPPLAVPDLPLLSSISKAAALLPNGKELGNVVLASEGEGPFCVLAKTQLLQKPNWAAFLSDPHCSAGLYFSDAKF